MIPPLSTANASSFAFADPADATLFWRHDKIHFPDPLAPMEAAMLQRALGHGLTHAAAAYNVPIERVEMRSMNGYHYRSIVMVAGSSDEMVARSALAERSVCAAIARLDELWTEKVLPEVREHLGFWESFDLAGATRRALTAHVAETWDRLRRAWELRFEVGLPASIAISEFDELYRGLFPDASPLDSYRLLEGLPNMTAEAGQELWRLSRRAIESNAVRAIIQTGDARKVPVVLNATSAGRERAIAAAREALANHPAAVVGQFKAKLAAAQAGKVLTADCDFWIDNMTIHHLRAVLLEAGRRLVDDGALTSANDVFMLEPEELRDALIQPGVDLRFPAAVRAHAMECQALMTAPAVLGTAPEAPPVNDPFARFAAKCNGMLTMEQAGEDDIHGSSSSARAVSAARLDVEVPFAA
ncbi:MAG: hypothetical protein QOK16_1324 [Solirubrobacteraceae bacterium]|nr:hypothetical protein [Solirubrobacteraceae bacterium]